MGNTDIIAVLAREKPALQAKGVQHLALFGSYARGDARPDSDLDVLVDIDPALSRFSLLDLIGIADHLTDATGIETNALERRTVGKNPRFAGRIADDIIEIF